MWEQTDVLHYRRHAPLRTRCISYNHCMPCIQAVTACLACISFVDSLMDRCAWITAFSTPRFPRRSLPNGRARCAPRSSRGWLPDLPIDEQQSPRGPVLPYSNRPLDDLSAWQGRGKPACKLPVSLASFWRWCVSVWLYSHQTFADIYLALCREKEAQKGKTLSPSSIRGYKDSYKRCAR